jgi:hypothetical protein
MLVQVIAQGGQKVFETKSPIGWAAGCSNDPRWYPLARRLPAENHNQESIPVLVVGRSGPGLGISVSASHSTAIESIKAQSRSSN